LPNSNELERGLSKIEYMATIIMGNLCVPAIPGTHNSNDPREASFKAQMAVRLAKALIDELNKEG
jgi:hypothetical protein